MLYHDYIRYMDSEEMYIHISNEAILQKEVIRPILLVSHNLSITGAPIALLDLTRVLMKNGYQAFVVSLVDGDILEAFLRHDAVVLVYSGRSINVEWLKKAVSIFPAIVVNTLVLAPLVRILAPVGKKIFWWIHESEYLFLELDYVDIPEIPSLHILAASPKVSKSICDHMGKQSYILNVMVNDYHPENKLLQKDDTIHFFWGGFINFNKMPELLLRAVLELPEIYRKRADFTFCGDGVDIERTGLIKNCADEFSNIYYLPTLPHQEFIDLMDRMDVVVVCSKEETTSLVAVEGLMLEKIVICSDGCGVADYLKDGINSFMFAAGDHSQLCQKIKYVVDQFDRLKAVKKAGRKIYERYYTEEAFEKQVLHFFGGQSDLS